MNSLFASIRSAASRSLLLIVIPVGLRIEAVALNFLNPLGDNVALKILLLPADLGINFTYNFSSDLAPIRNPSIDAATRVSGLYPSSSPR